jgi:hypothetical protein
MTEDEKLEFVSSAIAPMAWHTLPYVASVVAIESNEIGAHVGSALRLESAGRRMIVTAAHVADQACGARFGVTAVRGAPPIELTAPPDHIDRALDVAAWVLAETYPPVAFWPIDRVDTSDELRATDFLFVHGFPQRRSLSSPLLGGIVSRSLPYGVMQRDDELPPGMQPFQFAMDFDPVSMLTPDGGAADWVEPHGLSGSAVWRIGASGHRTAEWGPERAQLVGLVTTWRPAERLLLATKIAPLLGRVGS